MGLPLVRFDLVRYQGVVDSSERNIRSALKLAEAVIPVLFIDEIEKGLSGVGGSGDLDSEQVCAPWNNPELDERPRQWRFRCGNGKQTQEFASRTCEKVGLMRFSCRLARPSIRCGDLYYPS